MKKLNKKSVGFCILPQLMKYRKDAKKYKRLYIEQGVNRLIEERRVKLERLETGFYAGLSEWITDNIFLQDLSTEELSRKVDEFRLFRQRRYKELLNKREELRTLEIDVLGHLAAFEIH